MGKYNKKESNKKYKRSLRGKALGIYHSQVQTSIKRGHKLPEYTKKEFVDWIIGNDRYIELHSNWVESGYKRFQAPSCDRIDDYKSYSFDNIQLVTWEENHKKGASDIRNGINTKKCKSVIMVSDDDKKLIQFHSTLSAARYFGKNDSSFIVKAIKKGCKAYGFKWKYAEHT